MAITLVALCAFDLPRAALFGGAIAATAVSYALHRFRLLPSLLERTDWWRNKPFLTLYCWFLVLFSVLIRAFSPLKDIPEVFIGMLGQTVAAAAATIVGLWLTTLLARRTSPKKDDETLSRRQSNWARCTYLTYVFGLSACIWMLLW